MLKLSILGSGGFGCSIAKVYSNNGFDITLWSYKKQEADEIKLHSENIHYLPGVKIPNTIKITSNIKEALNADVIFIVVPSKAIISTINLMKGLVSPQSVVICLSKGIEENSLKLFSDILEESFQNNQTAVLLGPSHAEEIARNEITAMVASSKNPSTIKYIQQNLNLKTLRIYANNDIIGVQIGAALKNIVALAIGICDGMKLGDNTKAALMTRGLQEIALIGVALGAKKQTFLGLTGVGDLIVTCTSLHSRNRRAGILIGQGVNVTEAIAKVGMTVEGYICTKCAYELSTKYKLETPIINEMFNILYKHKDVDKALNDLLSRPYKPELL